MTPFRIWLPILLAACTGATDDLPTVDLLPDRPTTLDDLVATVHGAEGRALRFRWLRNGREVPSLTGSTVPASDTTRGDTWTVEVEVEGLDVRPSDTVEVVNAPPTATVTLAPDAADSTVDVVATAVGTDPDGDPVTFTYRWTVDDAPTDVSGEVLPALRTRGGQRWTVHAVPSDGLDEGEPATAEIVIGNGPPVLGRVWIVPDPLTAASDAAATTDASDPDDDDLEFTWAWTVDGEPAGNGPTLPASAFARGAVVEVTVTATDGEFVTDTVSSGPVTVRNAPPSVSEVTLDPAPPRVASTLACTPHDVIDADGDPVDLVYAWTVNDELVPGAGEATLAGVFQRGDVVACTVTPFDPAGAGVSVRSPAYTVANTPPVLASPRIVHVKPGTGEPLKLSWLSVHDDDGDDVTVSAVWYVNGTQKGTGLELPASAFSAGAVVRADLTPHDGIEAGTTVSTPAIVVGNLPPEVLAVRLDPAVPNRDTGVTAVPTVFDPNEDDVTWEIRWRVNGNEVKNFVGDTLPGTRFARGDVVQAVVVPSDADTPGAAFVSDGVTIGNAPPRLTGARFLPEEIDETKAARCSPQGWSDADGDAARPYHFSWTVNGIPVPLTSDLATGAVFDKGDVLTCTVIPDDGTDLGEPVSVSTVVGNAPARVSSVTLSPSQPRTNDEIVATAVGLTDPDAADLDGLTVTWTWRVDNVVVPGVTGDRLPGTFFEKGSTVVAVAHPRDADGAGVNTTSAPVVVQNTPPSVTQVRLTPTSPTREGPIVAEVTLVDADAVDTPWATYVWTVNNTVVADTDASLDPAFFRKNDVVKVTVTPHDGTDAGTPVTSSTVTVRNAPPAAPRVVAQPRRPAAGLEDLRCRLVAPATDPDGDNVSYTFAWKRNGVPVTSGTTSGSFANDTVPAALVGPGEHWTCTVTASDGPSSSAPATADAHAVAYELASLVAGADFTCGIDADGEVRCWGANGVGQALPPAGQFRKLDALGGAACGIRDSGAIACWGDNAAPLSGIWRDVDVGSGYACGQRSVGDLFCWGTDTLGRLAAPSGLGWHSLTVGTNHACALNASGLPTCWGGTNAQGERNAPAGVRFSLIEAGSNFTCGLDLDGAVVCWGAPAITAGVPQGIFVDLTAGVGHACAIDATGAATCWGSAPAAALDVPPGPWARLTAGEVHTCGAREDGSVVCWGDDAEGQSTPTLGAWVDVAVGWDHACAIDPDGEVACWGRDDQGQATVPDLPWPAVDVVAGEAHTCALLEDGSITCWGDDSLDQLAAPTTGTYGALSAGRNHTCALDDAGHVACWGDDTWNQSKVPPSLVDEVFVDVAAAEHHTCAVQAADGRVRCWGTRWAPPTFASELVPPDIPFLTVTGGYATTCGLRTTGALRCWGDDTWQIVTFTPGATDWVEISSGRMHVCARTTGGLVECWGSGTWGVDDAIPGTYALVEAGADSNCALRSDGRLRCWGRHGRW